MKSGNETAFQQAASKMIAHVKAHEAGTLTYILNRSAHHDLAAVRDVIVAARKRPPP